MKKAIIFRPGHAMGDAIFITPLPRILKETGGYDVVDIACQWHNFEIFKGNPYLDEMIEVPKAEDSTKEWNDKFYERLGTYDKVYAASGHIEMGLLQRTDADWGTIPSGAERREKAKGVSYQDYIYSQMELKQTGLLPEFYFDAEEKAQMKAMKDELDKDRMKLVLWNWSGSSKSKELMFGPQYLKKVLERHQHSMHYIFTQNNDLMAQIPEHPRAVNAWGASTIRNTIMMCSVSSLVIGPESFMVNAAAAFDTPKMIFFSHSAPENLAKYYKNCMAVVPMANVKCHPCYLIHCDFRTIFHPEKRAIAREYERECELTTNRNPYRMMGYKCCFFLPHEEIVGNILKTLKRGK